MAISLGQEPDPTLLKEIEDYYKIQESIKQSSKNFLNDFVEELKNIKEEVSDHKEETLQQPFEFPKPPSLDDLFEQKIIIQEVQTSTPVIPKPPSLSDLEEIFDLTEEVLDPPKEVHQLAKLASDHITKEVKFEEKSPFAAQEVNVEKTLLDLKKKLKFLEDWVSRISSTGPGSGEVNLLSLDDVDTTSLGNNKYLKYNSTTGKLEFASVSGGGGGGVTSVAGATGDVSNVEILNGIVTTGYLNTSNISEGSNLYFTNARARSAFSAGNNIVIESNGQISANVTGGGGGSVDFTAVSSNIIPTANSVFNLGAPNLRWKTLFLANNTIDLGGALIQSDGTGALTISSSGAILPVNSKVQVGNQDKQIALVGNSGTITTVVPFYTESQGLNTAATNFTFGFNPDDYVFTNFTFGNGQTLATGGITQFYF